MTKTKSNPKTTMKDRKMRDRLIDTQAKKLEEWGGEWNDDDWLDFIRAELKTNDLKWKKRIERNYFYGRRDGLNEALLLTKKDIIKRSKQCQKEAEKLTNLLTKEGV